MDDLVKRLREFAIHTPLSKPMLLKAADRIEALEARIVKVREEALREASRECAYACGCQDAVLALIEKDEPLKAKKPNLVGTGVQMGILNKNPGS